MAVVQSRSLTDPEYVLTLLTNRMSPDSRPVFLLGAGCSKQYGLPSFRDLLLALWEDYLHYSGDGRSTEELREGLEKLWQTLGPKDRKNILKSYLGGIRGNECPGYLRLAGLAESGKLKVIVNMNFDTLLEDALDHRRVKYRVSTSFQEPEGEDLLIYKPHGSIGEVFQEPKRLASGSRTRLLNDLILDIAKGDLFADPEEQEKAQKLLTGHHVVALGYSGVDAKIDATLLGFPKADDPRNLKLFIINLESPDPRLVMAQEERGSRGLSILGEEGSFESFMEELEKALEKSPGQRLAEEPTSDAALWGTWEASTRAEKTALGQCIKLAQILGSGLAGQEISDFDLEKHGLQVYFNCRLLARLAGIRLTSPEKHVLQCAALLHDLGQLSTSRVEESGGDNPNLKRLENHGEITALLIERRVPRGSALRENLVPASYGEKCRGATVEAILGAILLLCRRHTFGFPALEEEGRAEEVFVGNWPVPLRKGLLLAMFALAEELVGDQPLLKSLEAYLDVIALMEDPIPALSWRWRRDRLLISVEGRALRWKLLDRAHLYPNLSGSFIVRILGFLERFNEAVAMAGRESRCVGVEPDTGPRVDEDRVQEELKQYLRASAEEALSESAGSVEPGSAGELPDLLDLLAIYTLRAGDGQPWLPIESDAVRAVLERVCPFEEAVPRNLLLLYFLARKREAPSSLEKAFISGFEDIIYPAWRFVARQWRNRTAIIPLATFCLDMGSSRFRAEALEGIPLLLEAHVHRLHDGRVHAHDECTFCTSRLLTTFSNARLLFSEEALEKMAPGPGSGLDLTVAGFLQHFLKRDSNSAAWWGFGGESTRLRAPDYLAWAARALARFLATDDAIRSRSGGERGWLENLEGIERSDIDRLLQERWRALLAVKEEDLVSSNVEVIRTLALGRLAGAYLELDTCPSEIRDRALEGSRSDEFVENLGRVSKFLAGPFKNEWLAERLHLMPVDLVRDSLAPDEGLVRQLVDLYLQSKDSPAWVRRGPDAGSWGFESRHTEQILSSLVAFWRHAFLSPNRGRFDAAFREAIENPNESTLRR